VISQAFALFNIVYMKNILSKLKIFLEPTRENKKAVLFLLFIEILGVVVFLGINILFQQFLQSIENNQALKNIIIYGSVIVVMILFMFVLRLVNYKLDPINFSAFKKFLYRKFLHKYLLLDNQKVYKYGTGKFISIINSWIEHRWQALSIGIFDMARYVIGFLLNLAFIAYINTNLIIPVIVFSIFMFLWVYKVGKRTYPHRQEITNIEDNISKQVVLMIMEKFIILKNNKIQQEEDKLQKEFDRLEHHSIKAYFYNNLLYNWSQTIVDLFKIVFIIFIGIQTYLYGGSIANIATIILVSNFLSNYIQNFTYSYKDLSIHIVRVFKLIKTFEEIPSIQKYNIGKEFKYISGNISFDKIEFWYNKSTDIFKNFSLDIVWWKRTAIIGKSWIGKSTIIKLIMWFIEPNKWRIIIDGQYLDSLALKSYYKPIGYLSQEASVFDWTLKENIIYGIDNEVSEEKLKKIISLAECDFIYNLPEGLETQIGEKGIMLSWWERQRLAIARLFLQDPKILLLDEPTASLDIDSEKKITVALHNLFVNRTVVIVAHKIETIKDFDDIIILGKNKIIDRWTMHQLITRHGNFKDFFK